MSTLSRLKVVFVLVLGFAVMGLCAFPGKALAEHTRVTNPNALSLEVLGRGLFYGVSFDRVVSDDLVAGVSFGHTPLQTLAGDDANKNTTLLPVYMNYYFMREAGSIFATVGVDLVFSSNDVQDLKATYSGVEFRSSPILPMAGIGYENRGDTGFLFRVALYGILGKKLAPWGGFSMGYAF